MTDEAIAAITEWQWALVELLAKRPRGAGTEQFWTVADIRKELSTQDGGQWKDITENEVALFVRTLSQNGYVKLTGGPNGEYETNDSIDSLHASRRTIDYLDKYKKWINQHETIAKLTLFLLGLGFVLSTADSLCSLLDCASSHTPAASTDTTATRTLIHRIDLYTPKEPEPENDFPALVDLGAGRITMGPSPLVSSTNYVRFRFMDGTVRGTSYFIVDHVEKIYDERNHLSSQVLWLKAGENKLPGWKQSPP